jgi:hypothetical protein
MTRSLRFVCLALSLAALVLAATGCPKDDTTTTATPLPTATTATPAETTTAAPTATPPAVADATPADVSAAPWSIRYDWSGGLSIYHHYSLAIEGKNTAKVVFKVKPMRQDEVTVEDTLDEETFKELKGLFALVNFDEVTTKPRRVRVMDIGQTTITRDLGGKKHEVMENPAQQAATDIKPLRQWLDQRVRLYLEKSGVGPKKSTPAPSPAATP